MNFYLGLFPVLHREGPSQGPRSRRRLFDRRHRFPRFDDVVTMNDAFVGPRVAVEVLARDGQRLLDGLTSGV